MAKRPTRSSRVDRERGWLPVAARVAAELLEVGADDAALAAEWVEWSVRGEIGPDGLPREIRESRLSGVSLTGLDLERVRISDTVFEDCELSGVLLGESALTRVEFHRCRMSGVQFGAARMREVRFVGCKLDGASLRMATLERVRFESCVMSSSDWYSATLQRVSILDGDLTDAELSQVRVDGLQLHGTTIDQLRGPQHLRGAIVDEAQMIPLALQLLTATGIVVDDDRDQTRD